MELYGTLWKLRMDIVPYRSMMYMELHIYIYIYGTMWNPMDIVPISST